jgi:hypothetical protein
VRDAEFVADCSAGGLDDGAAGDQDICTPDRPVEASDHRLSVAIESSCVGQNQ